MQLTAFIAVKARWRIFVFHLCLHLCSQFYFWWGWNVWSNVVSQSSQTSTLCCIREMIWLAGKALALRSFLCAILFRCLWWIQNYLNIGNTRLRRASALTIRRWSLVLAIIAIFSVLLTSGAKWKHPLCEFHRSQTKRCHLTDIEVGHNIFYLGLLLQQKWDWSERQ